MFSLREKLLLGEIYGAPSGGEGVHKYVTLAHDRHSQLAVKHAVRVALVTIGAT